MKVSVIMAVYNNSHDKILETAIKSILEQTLDDLELIICDDASTDSTYEILKELKKTDSRIILIRNNKNLKAGQTRNNCIDISKGEYIAIMDSDDFSKATRIEKQLKFLEENKKFDFVGTKGQFFTGEIQNLKGEYWFLQSPQKKDFLFTLPFVHGSIMFRKCAIKKVDGYSKNEITQRSEDYDMLMRMYAKGLRGFNLEEVLYLIREDENTFKRRKYRYRINECYTKLLGFTNMGLMPGAIPYVVKPIIVGLIPIPILNRVKKIYFRKG